MSEDEKKATLKRLREDPRVQVALFSLKAGSVGGAYHFWTTESNANSLND